MPPRYAYWTILIDQKPTAFRAREREELLPTFHQLRRKNTDVVMKWFARGRLWESPEEAQAAQRVPKPPLEKRGRNWRPGGEHRDPRDRFKKRSQPQGARSESWRDREKPSGRPPARPWGNKPASGPPRSSRPWADKPTSAPPRSNRPWADKPTSGPPRSSRPWADKPTSGPPRSSRPWADKPTSGSPRSSRPWADKPKSVPPRAARPWGSKPTGQRRDNDRRDPPQAQPPRKPWSSAPETETHKRTPQTPSSPPAAEKIVTKPKPPENS